MLVSLELNPRQMARVLAAALHNRVRVELEPRPETCDELLWGTLVGEAQSLLEVDLTDRGRLTTLDLLVGAACEVRTIIAGELYLFSTCIMEIVAERVPPRLRLAPPEFIQVANRRRYTRSTTVEPVPVSLGVPGVQQPFLAELANISAGGIRCRVSGAELGELLFIGDLARVDFSLPWTNEVYSVQATVCVKEEARDQTHLLVGLEFGTQRPEDIAVLERLRAALLTETSRLTEQNGDL